MTDAVVQRAARDRPTLAGMRVLVLVAAIVPLVASMPWARAADDHSGWKQVWSDEFDVDGRPNPANWTCERGFVRNEELQWYRQENASCSGGLLVIEARREHLPRPGRESWEPEWARLRDSIDYTSASLTTRGLHSWRYGRFEFRARIDARPGLWPAIWTVGDRGPWPHGGEIDVMEYYQGTVLANVFWGGRRRWEPRSQVNRFPVARFGDDDWTSRFHVWRMDWTEEAIDVAIDDEPLCRFDLADTENEGRRGGNPLRQPQHLLLSLAIGGTQGGDPAETEFPARFEVDYVRVFERAE